MKQIQKYLTKHHMVFGFFGTCLALTIAGVYMVIVPEESSRVNGLERIILLYGHSACWTALAIASLLWGINRKNTASIYLAYSALAIYAVFMATLLLNK